MKNTSDKINKIISDIRKVQESVTFDTSALSETDLDTCVEVLASVRAQVENQIEESTIARLKCALDDMCTQADEDTPLERRSAHFNHALDEGRELLKELSK